SEERKKIMRAYGADLVFTPGGESDVDLSLERLAKIRAGDPAGYWVPGQFDNADNVEAHYRTTGPELWEQAGGVIGAFVASQGSGGAQAGRASPRAAVDRDDGQRHRPALLHDRALRRGQEGRRARARASDGSQDPARPRSLPVGLGDPHLRPAEYDFVAARRRLEAKPKSAGEKLTTLEDAAGRVKDGVHGVAGGCLFNRTPMALVPEIRRQRRTGLTL